MGRQFNSVQCVGWFLSHFSTAGLCNMPVGVFSRPLLTTGDYGIQAERGSSLLQGGSGSEEGLRSNPPPGAKPPSSAVGKPPSCCRGFASVSQLLLTKLLLTLTDLAETGTGGLLVKPIMNKEEFPSELAAKNVQ